MNDKINHILDSLMPTTEDYDDNSRYIYWLDYACEIDILKILNDQVTSDAMIEYLCERIKTQDTPVKDACTDVASTIESLMPEYRGKFVYN